LVTIATAAIVVATGGSAAIIAGAALGGTISVGMTALFDKIKNKVSSVNEYMLNGFTGAVTGAISGGIDKAKKLGEGTKLLSKAVSGFIIGTGEDAARQVLLEGKKEVNLGQSVMKGIMNATLAIAVPLIIKGGQAVVNKIKAPGVNRAVGEVVEKGAKSLGNNADEMAFGGVCSANKSVGIAQSRINIANGPTRFSPSSKAGLEHVIDRHFNPTKNAGQFSISVDELKSILSRKDVIDTPISISKTSGQFGRVFDVGYDIGTIKPSMGGQKTSWIEIFTDSKGNLITTYPIPTP
ncbi:hypothetical protein, partial [Criibacterium bergeronii]|uniref:hypothetical protein n=1 Tax=Criibacterium bergeronii TaxID=1871336 RepID=UPI001A9BB34D